MSLRLLLRCEKSLVSENDSFLTALQLEIMERLEFFEGDITRTAEDMGRTENSVYGIIYTIRQSRVKAQNTVNQVNVWMRNKYLRRYIY